MNIDTLKRLLDVSRQLAENRRLDLVLEYALDSALELTGAEYAYLSLVDSDGSVRFPVNRTVEGRSLTEDEVEVSRTIMRQVIDTLKPVVTAHAGIDPQFRNKTSVKGFNIRSVACVPLQLDDEVIGALYLENRSQIDLFDAENVEQLQSFAGLAAIAIRNAGLNDELEARVAQRTRQLIDANEKLEEEISERTRAEAEIVAIGAEQERIAMLKRFIQDTSHQFRTPLTVINTQAALLQRKLELDPQDTFNMQTGVESLVDLVEALVTMVRLDSGIDVEDELVDVVVLLRDVLQGTIPETHYPEFSTAVPKLFVQGDAHYIGLAFRYLIENAVKYSPDGGPIEVDVSVRGDYAQVDVVDHGVGIHEKDLPLLFNRFFRSDPSQHTSGVGMSLALSHTIVTTHGGQIDVESVVGEGTLFRVILPLAASERTGG